MMTSPLDDVGLDLNAKALVEQDPALKLQAETDPDGAHVAALLSVADRFGYRSGSLYHPPKATE
jgi:hypothetical protein